MSSQDVEDNSKRFGRVLPVLLAAPSRWAPALETALPASLTQLCCLLSEEEKAGADVDDPRRGVMWFGGGDCFDGEAVFEALQKLQRRAEEFRFLGALACVCTSARNAVAAVAKVSPADMEVQVAQAAAMVPLCAQAMTAEVLQEVSIDQVRRDAVCERVSGAEMPLALLSRAGHLSLARAVPAGRQAADAQGRRARRDCARPQGCGGALARGSAPRQRARNAREQDGAPAGGHSANRCAYWQGAHAVAWRREPPAPLPCNALHCAHSREHGEWEAAGAPAGAAAVALAQALGGGPGLAVKQARDGQRCT